MRRLYEEANTGIETYSLHSIIDDSKKDGYPIIRHQTIITDAESSLDMVPN